MGSSFVRAIAYATLSLGALGSAAAQPQDDEYTTLARFDNDIFFGSDRGYSNGGAVASVSPTVARFDATPLSMFDRTLNRWLSPFQLEGYDYNNVVKSVSHQIFTPDDREQQDLIEDDRPYAAALLFGVSYNSRDEDTMQTILVQAGIVGPAAAGEDIQDFVHGLVGSDKFRGWRHQLRDEPVVRVMRQWFERWNTPHLFDSALSGDVIVHGGGSLGNLTTFANAGVEMRVGFALPDDFGSAPILPTTETVSPRRRSNYTERLTAHLFVAIDVRYVAHDITLDGNTWRDSHSVERETTVADIGIGVAANWRGWQVALARYVRTREFVGQEERPEIGSISIRRGVD
jgi:lipid A 3-O-deacylase